MTGQILDRILTAYRIGDPNGRFPIFDATGSTLFPGRWNTPKSPVIYTSEHYATAMLEKLVYASSLGKMPPNQHFIKITIQSGLSYEMLSAPSLPGWDDPSALASKTYGEQWQQSPRSLILMVPSVVAREELNILINPQHPEFPKITHSLHQPIWWDSRLF